MSTRGQEPFRHVTLFYRGIDDYLDALTTFVANGTNAAERVAVAVPDGNGTALRAELGPVADHHSRCAA